MKANRIFAAFASATVALILVGIWLGRAPTERPPETGPEGQTELTGNLTPAVKPIEPRLVPAPRATTAVTTTVATANPPPVALLTNWDEHIENILHLDEAEKVVARRLLALLPQLPEEGRVEAIQHAVNLLDDEDYAPLQSVLTDVQQPAEVLDELIADLLNRKTSVMLPALLEVAKLPEHPNAEEARDYLELYLDENYENDWPFWERKLKEWLDANPD